MKQLFTYIWSQAGGSDDLPIRIRSYRLFCAIAVVLCFCVIIPLNLLQNLSPLVNISVCCFGVVTAYLYFAANRGRYHIALFYLLLLLVLNITWFVNGGSQGSVSLFFPSAFMYAVITFQGKKRWLWCAVFLANIIVLQLADFLHPEWIVPFTSQLDRLIDHITGIIVSVFMSIAVLWAILYSYDRKQQQLLDQNDELTAIQEELVQQLDETLRVQNELRLSEESFRTVADWTYDWEYWIAPDFHVVYMSPSCERITGIPPHDFIADASLLARIVHPDDRPFYHQHLNTTLPHAHSKSDDLANVTFRVIHQDGSVHWIDHVCRPVFSVDGKYLGRRVSNRDITEHRLLEQQIIQQQKLESVGLLAGGIAHDFNNLLAPIFIYAEMVKNKLAIDDPSHHKMSTIIEAAGRAKDLVRQLLTFSSKQQLTSQLHDLNRITGDFADMLRRTLRENIELKLLLCEDTCPVMADKTQLEQIMLNLAVNAQDAISDNGSITIETGHLILDNEYCSIHLGVTPGRYVMLSFSDTGCGMDDTTLNHVFEPFFTTKTAGRGTGLGLSTVYGIVKQHGGHISIKSTPGAGTVFQVFLPESQNVGFVASETDLPGTNDSSAIGAILLVEDNEMVREMTTDLLETHHFKVLAAEDPDVALTLFRQHQDSIALLLTDIVMPIMSGSELYEQLLIQEPTLKVLFMSGYANNVSVHKGVLDDGVNFIAKPFTSETLIKKINELTSPAGGNCA
jgi:PAS domain S-box-containing protein